MIRLFQRVIRRRRVIRLAVPSQAFEGGLHLERWELRSHRLVAAGKASATGGTLALCREGEEVVKPLPAGAGGAIPFQLEMPFAPGRLWLEHRPEMGVARRHALSMLPVWRLWLAALRLLPGFLWSLVRVSPLMIRWAILADPALRRQARVILGLEGPDITPGVDPAMLPPARAAQPAPSLTAIGGFTCILPVHGGEALLREVLARFLANSDLPWHLILVEDASPDPDLRAWLRGWAERQNSAVPADAPCVTLLENAHNLGFVGSVNRAFPIAIARGDPVVLLNSDVLLPAAWSSRLLAPLAVDPLVASVTPMSNDAEILSVPVAGARLDLCPGQVDVIDRIAAHLPQAAVDVELPTGIGFCMALSPAWLVRVPRFDIAFSPGYGEEVDWCHRTAALGARHLGTATVFVEHRGGASFGSRRRQNLRARSAAEIRRRWPRHEPWVQAWMAADPLATARMCLGLALAASRDETELVSVHIAHSLGGGAEYWLQDQLAARIEDAGTAVVLRFGGARRWQIELHSAAGISRLAGDDLALAARLLHLLPRMRLIYSCAVGDRDPVALPEFFRGLLRPDDRLEMLFHDFFPLSPSWRLLAGDGRFHGLPVSESLDPAHSCRRPDGSTITLAEWRQKWHRLAEASEQITVFSQSSRRLLVTAWPDLSGRVRVHPHTPSLLPELRPPGGRRRPVVAVLGNLDPAKGHALVDRLLRRSLRAHSGPELVLIGASDPACRPLRGLRSSGEYRREDLPFLARRFDVSAWLIASIWPETWSYTTHEALATGLPVFCLDLGAQAEAVRAASGGQGHVVALDLDVDRQAERLLVAMRSALGMSDCS